MRAAMANACRNLPWREDGALDWRALWFCATSGGVPRRALGVTVIVGTLLNAINQGNALLGDGKVNWVKLVLTYAVPYCVATYGAVSVRLPAMRATASLEEPTERAR
jgi:hypothetical protein